jgi:hypothetical protein
MPGTTQSRLLVAAVLAIACAGEPTAPSPPELSGSWRGANAVAALEVRLSNVSVTFPCPAFGCSGQQTVERIRLEGTYRDLRTGEVVDLVTDTERRTDGLVDFTLYMRDDGRSQFEGITYATTRLVGWAVDAGTIEATLLTDYQKSSGGNSITWTTWSADSSALTLRRR